MDNGRVLKPGQCAQVEIQHLACYFGMRCLFIKKKHVTNSHSWCNILHIFNACQVSMWDLIEEIESVEDFKRPDLNYPLIC